jgi:hypothetical protein
MCKSMCMNAKKLKFSEVPVQMATISMVVSNLTTRPYHFRSPKMRSFVQIIFKFSDHQYGGTHPYRSPRTTSSTKLQFFGIHPVQIATTRTGRYDRTVRPYQVHRLNPEPAIPSTGRLYPYCLPIPRVGPRLKHVEEVNLNPKFSYSLSFSSKLKTNSIGSSNLFVFYSIPRTPSNHGTFLLRSPTYFQRLHALDFAIINLDLGLIMNFITLMSM